MSTRIGSPIRAGEYVTVRTADGPRELRVVSYHPKLGVVVCTSAESYRRALWLGDRGVGFRVAEVEGGRSYWPARGVGSRP